MTRDQDQARPVAVELRDHTLERLVAKDEQAAPPAGHDLNIDLRHLQRPLALPDGLLCWPQTQPATLHNIDGAIDAGDPHRGAIAADHEDCVVSRDRALRH